MHSVQVPGSKVDFQVDIVLNAFGFQPGAQVWRVVRGADLVVTAMQEGRDAAGSIVRHLAAA